MKPQRRKLYGRLAALLAIVLLTCVVYWKRGSLTEAEQRASSSAGSSAGPNDRHEAAARLRGSREPLLSGIVVGAENEALVSATVCVSCTACDRALPSAKPVCAATREDGRYAFHQLPSGYLLVTASAPEHAPAVGNPHKPIHVDGLGRSERREVDFKLVRGGVRVAGVVQDTTGGPVAAAKVAAMYRLDAAPFGVAQSATTDEEGRFVITAAPGPVLLTAEAEGYAVGRATRTAPAEGVELVVTPAAGIRGKVVNDDGEPLADVRVTAQTELLLPSQTATDESGSFHLQGLMPGVYRLRASGAKWIGEYHETVALDLAETADGIVIVARAAASVSGKLVTTDGKPCPEGHVFLSPSVQDYSLPLLEAIAGVQGEALFEAVPAGTYRVAGACAGDEPIPLQVLEVAQKDLTELTFEVPARLSIAGKVVDKSGKPLPNLNLFIADRSGGLNAPSVLSGEDGSFEFRGLMPGQYSISADDLLSPASVDVPEGKSVRDLRLVAEAVGRISVRVRGRTGEHVDKVSVYPVMPKNLPGNPGQPIGDGVYRIGPLPAGSYPVYVDDGVNPVVRVGGEKAELTVRAGETTHAEVQFGGHRGRITGRVHDGSGDPVPNVWVYAQPNPGGQGLPVSIRQQQLFEAPKRTLSGDDGTFEIEGLSEGDRFVVIAQRPLGGQAKLENISAGSTVELVLHAPGSIAGVAFGSDGKPVDHVFCQLRNKDTGQLRSDVVYAREGSFRLQNVTPGSIELVVADSQRNIAMAALQLAPKQHLEGVRLDLKPLAAPSPGGAVAGATSAPPPPSLAASPVAAPSATE